MRGKAAIVPATSVFRTWASALEGQPLTAEVGMADPFVARELLGLVREYDLARFEAVAAVRDAESHVGVLLHEQDRRAALVDLPDRPEDGGDELRRQPERRLVEEEHLRLRHE